MKLYDVYNFLGTLIAILFGLGSLTYYTIAAYREQRKAQLDKEQSIKMNGILGANGSSGNGHSDYKEQAGLLRTNSG